MLKKMMLASLDAFVATSMLSILSVTAVVSIILSHSSIAKEKEKQKMNGLIHLKNDKVKGY